LTETIAYFEYLQSQTVSYKFLRDNNALFSFIKNYDRANKLLETLETLSETTQTQAKTILQKCYDEVQYFELREAISSVWDYHMKLQL
jgi:hypothetical protein